MTRRPKVVLVGLGAIGSPVAVNARNWDADLVLIDFDRVENKNTQAQAYGRQALRRNKAQSMAQILQGMWGLRVKAVPHKLTDANVQQLLAGAALVIDCTDNIAARQLIQGFCTENGIPCLHGGLAVAGDFARVMWTEHFTPHTEPAGDVPTCEDGENLPFHSIVGAHIANEAQHFLRDGTKRSFQLTHNSQVRMANTSPI